MNMNTILNKICRYLRREEQGDKNRLFLVQPKTTKKPCHLSHTLTLTLLINYRVTWVTWVPSKQPASSFERQDVHEQNHLWHHNSFLSSFDKSEQECKTYIRNFATCQCINAHKHVPCTAILQTKLNRSVHSTGQLLTAFFYNCFKFQVKRAGPARLTPRELKGYGNH